MINRNSSYFFSYNDIYKKTWGPTPKNQPTLIVGGTYSSSSGTTVNLSDYFDTSKPVFVATGRTGENFTIPNNWNFIIWIDNNGNITSSSVSPGQIVQFKSQIVGGAQRAVLYTCDGTIGCTEQVIPGIGDGYTSIQECGDNCCQNSETGVFGLKSESCDPNCNPNACAKYADGSCSASEVLCAGCLPATKNCVCAAYIPGAFTNEELCECGVNIDACGGICISTDGSVGTEEPVTYCQCQQLGMTSSANDQEITCTCDENEAIECTDGKTPCPKGTQAESCCLPLCYELAGCGQVWNPTCNMLGNTTPSIIPNVSLKYTTVFAANSLLNEATQIAAMMGIQIDFGNSLTISDCEFINNNLIGAKWCSLDDLNGPIT